MRKYIFAALAALAGFSASAQEPWHFPLYLDCGVPASNRVEVEFSNSGNVDAEGAIVAISAKELGLAGKSRKSVRIVGENGNELLWNVSPFTKKIKKNAKIYIPVDCKAGGVSRAWVYFNANAALDLPDYLYMPLDNFSESFEYKNLESSPWLQKDTDADHINAITAKYAHSGKKSVHTKVAAGAVPNWVAVKKSFKVSKMKGKITLYAKCENVKCGKNGGAGFYVALFGTKNNMPDKFFHSKRISGTTDWTRLEVDVDIPDGYSTMNVGTVAWMSEGDAYFDSLSMKFDTENLGGALSYKVGKRERLSITREAEPEQWDVSPDDYDVRMLASVFNTRGEPTGEKLGFIPVKRVCAGSFSQKDYALYKNGKPVNFMLLGEIILFEAGPMQPYTESQYSLYLRRGRKNVSGKTEGAKQDSYVMSDQKANVRVDIDLKAYEKILNSPSNLAKNPSFEDGIKGWRKREKTDDRASVVDGGLFGKKALRLNIPGDNVYYGLHQDIPIKPFTDYIYVAAVRAPKEKVIIPRVCLTAPGVKDAAYSQVLSGGIDGWDFNAVTVRSCHAKPRARIDAIETKNAEILVDGAIFAECARAEKYEAQTAFDKRPDKSLAAWQVNSVIKVFPFYAPPKESAPAEIALARNEYENLQLAVRANKPMDGVEIDVSEAVSAGGDKLKVSQKAVAGYVTVDSKSNYYLFSHLKFHERCVPPNSMAEVYADPVIPQDKIDLRANKTESVWLTFYAGENTKAGVYKGEVKFKLDGEVLETVPYSVRVFDFTLPKQTHLTAIFDMRSEGSNGSWRPAEGQKGVFGKFYDRYQLQRFMATKRATIDHSEPIKIKWNPKTREYTADFEAFDKFCKMSFDELGLPMFYLNSVPCHCFARPVQNIDGVQPYEGKWPYADTKDFSKLRPEYIERIKKRTKLIYDHVRAKGWGGKFIMFMSDEPYYWQKNIADMLNAYFSEIHKHAPDALIYTSTWGYAEPLEKNVDVWGLNMSSANTPPEIEKIDRQKQKKIFTTDGNYCIDTPYNAQERIMAAFCFAGGFLGYEYWGVDWYMQNPFIWGMHKDRLSTPVPNVVRRNRFPNGDGYFIYSGELIGRDEIMSSVRMEAVRDGQEDYEYFLILDDLAKKTGDKAALATIAKIKAYAVYPNPGARNSTDLLPNPDAYTVELRNEIAAHIERLSKK